MPRPALTQPDRSATPAVSEIDTASSEAARARLFGIAYRVLGSRTDADDVVQDTVEALAPHRSPGGPRPGRVPRHRRGATRDQRLPVGAGPSLKHRHLGPRAGRRRGGSRARGRAPRRARPRDPRADPAADRCRARGVRPPGGVRLPLPPDRGGHAAQRGERAPARRPGPCPSRRRGPRGRAARPSRRGCSRPSPPPRAPGSCARSSGCWSRTSATRPRCRRSSRAGPAQPDRPPDHRRFWPAHGPA